ncbi:cytochrome P450 [Aspergillus alliaceus]|uniref:cytochrome P450 n=1 Tax=Petromyces alliaceus TaxID=209559 RepID=UPI0012A77BA1|nr:cytochrome P450 [Aspergillus alliaceus]KAB8227642.1 cytochrome P450 [Aspergillus alliaceus]
MFDVIPSYEKATLVAGAAILLGVLWVIGVVIYRLRFHALANFPGPKFNAISSIPTIRSLLQARRPMDIKILHDKFGPVVRVGPNELTFNSAKAWRDIYLQGMQKDAIHVGTVKGLPEALPMNMADEVTHSRLRRAIAPAFSAKAILEQEDVIQAQVTRLMEVVHCMGNKKEVFNMAECYKITTLDIILALIFGEELGCLEEGESNDWAPIVSQTVKESASEQAIRRLFGHGTILYRLLIGFIPVKLRAHMDKHLILSVSLARRRLEANTVRKDLMSLIMQQREIKGEISADEILVNSAVLLFAGSQTTASLLSALTYHLLGDKNTYTRLTTEIRSSFKDEDEICSKYVAKLPFLNACIEEALRIFPPAPIGLPRTVPKEGALIDGHLVPGGVTVSVVSWSATHNAANFQDPDSFSPNRWIDKDKHHGDTRAASQPFGLGPRACIGKYLAYLEARLIICRLLWNFDLVPADSMTQWDPSGEMKYMKTFTVWQDIILNTKAVPVERC